MDKKKIIIIILVLLILFGIYMLYNTFAVSTIIANDSNNIYDVVIGEDSTITVPKGSSKTIYFHLKNTNSAAVKYGVGYNASSNIEVKVYEDSKDKAIDIIGYGDNKYIKLYLNNPTDSNSNVTISCVLGYENGGDLIVDDGITLVTEVYTSSSHKITLASYITNLYASKDKTTVTNNKITYEITPDEFLINDRLGGTTTDLDGGNIRYYGASPNNYIYFNCETYPDTNCELWRIIGVFDGKVKIMRNESIGGYSWDTSSYTYNGYDASFGVNEWSQADLMKLLNPGYDTESVGGSLYYNSSKGTCYNGNSNATTSCDFTSIGIKNDVTRNKIAEVTWNLGGVGYDEYIYSNDIYTYERGTTVYSKDYDGVTRTTKWTGKVAVPYPSDYGYAAGFGTCISYLNKYNDDSCKNANWMYSILNNNGDSWLLTPTSDLKDHAMYTYLGYVFSGQTTYYHIYTSASHQIVPTLFLNSDETIVEGTIGTEDNPYKLNP